MFAEPVKRKIQTEQFFLASRTEKGDFDTKIIKRANISPSRLEYLLRNYYYRQQTELFLQRASNLFTAESLPDTLYILRKLENDTTIVAIYPLP